MSWSGYIPGSLLREILESPGGRDRFMEAIGYKEENDELRADIPEDQHAMEA